MLTATLRGASGFGTVVVGPLKHASLCLRSLHTSSEIYELPPDFIHHSEPASQITNLTWELHDFNTCNTASTSSGPVPSPFITIAVLPVKEIKSERIVPVLYLF